jgi:hypothetical protein
MADLAAGNHIPNRDADDMFAVLHRPAESWR